jgi:spore coat protein CotH
VEGAVRQLLVLFLVLGAATARPAAVSKPPPPTGVTNFVSHLPVVYLEAGERIVPETKVPCGVRLAPPHGAEPGNRLTGMVRLHGSSSLSYPKKSFALALDQPAGWLGMRTSPHWVLNAAFIDRSLMRHKLSYDLFRSLSTTNAPRHAAASRFVEVLLNGRYQGVYLLMERVDGDMLGFRRFETNAAEHACLYKAVDHAANFDRPGHAGFEQREPDPLLLEYWAPLDRLNRFVAYAKDDEFLDPRKGIATRLDLDNTMDFHLQILLTCNLDGFDKNLFLGRDAPRPHAPPPRFLFAPWDYDATFGRHWEGSRVGASDWLSNNLFDRLLGHPDYRRRFVARWRQLRQKEFSVATIHRLIDENVETLGAAAERNAARWRSAGGSYPDRLTFAQDVQQMKVWVERRTRWLDQEIGQLNSR